MILSFGCTRCRGAWPAMFGLVFAEPSGCWACQPGQRWTAGALWQDPEVEFTGHTATITSLSHVGVCGARSCLIPARTQPMCLPIWAGVGRAGPGSGLFLSSSKDYSIRMWNFMKKQAVATFTTESPVWNVRGGGAHTHARWGAGRVSVCLAVCLGACHDRGIGGSVRLRRWYRRHSGHQQE